MGLEIASTSTLIYIVTLPQVINDAFIFERFRFPIGRL